MNIPSVSPFSSIGHEPEFGPRVLIPHYEASHASEEDHRESSADPVNQFATRELSSSLNRPYQAEPIDRFTDSECVVIEVDDNATASDIESESSSESEPGTSTESESSTSSEFYRRNNRDNNQENFIRIKDHIFEPHRLYQGEGECCYYCTLRGRAQLYDSTNQEFYTRKLIRCLKSGLAFRVCWLAGSSIGCSIDTIRALFAACCCVTATGSAVVLSPGVCCSGVGGFPAVACCLVGTLCCATSVSYAFKAIEKLCLCIPMSLCPELISRCCRVHECMNCQENSQRDTLEECVEIDDFHTYC